MKTRKTVLITDGSSGIGKAMVLAFSRQDYRVLFTYHTGKDRADAGNAKTIRILTVLPI